MTTFKNMVSGATVMLITLWVLGAVEFMDMDIDMDGILISLAWWAISVFVTYVGLHLKADIAKVKTWIRAKKEARKAVAA